MEIVDNHDLVYRTKDDAVAKINNVLKNEDKQKTLLRHLENQSKKFSSTRFMSEVKSIVRCFFKENEHRVQ